MSGRKSSDDGVTTFIACLMLAAIVLPILGVYWAVNGDTENKRMIGGIILVICVIVAICSMFS